jgi:hypothetical protein
MLDMGFINECDWLAKLLEVKGGDIGKFVETLSCASNVSKKAAKRRIIQSILKKSLTIILFTTFYCSLITFRFSKVCLSK